MGQDRQSRNARKTPGDPVIFWVGPLLAKLTLDALDCHFLLCAILLRPCGLLHFSKGAFTCDKTSANGKIRSAGDTRSVTRPQGQRDRAAGAAPIIWWNLYSFFFACCTIHIRRLPSQLSCSVRCLLTRSCSLTLGGYSRRNCVSSDTRHQSERGEVLTCFSTRCFKKPIADRCYTEMLHKTLRERQTYGAADPPWWVCARGECGI